MRAPTYDTPKSFSGKTSRDGLCGVAIVPWGEKGAQGGDFLLLWLHVGFTKWVRRLETRRARVWPQHLTARQDERKALHR